MAESTPSGAERRRAPRVPLEPEEATLSFFVEEDEMMVTEVNVSETGVGFTTKKPLPVKMRLKYADHEEDRLAHLVWVRQKTTGAMSYGFEFDEA